MIRAVEISELPQFAELGRQFFQKLGLPGSFNVHSFCSVWNILISAGKGFILARFTDNLPKEAIGVIVHPDSKTGEPTACTDFWFFEEEPRGLEAGLLYDAIEFTCRNMNLKRLLIEVLCDERLPKVGGYLLKKEYKLTGMVYRKDLQWPSQHH